MEQFQRIKGFFWKGSSAAYLWLITVVTFAWGSALTGMCLGRAEGECDAYISKRQADC